MLTCRRHCSSSLFSSSSPSSFSPSLRLRRTYSALSSPTSASSAPPRDWRPKNRPLLDRIALSDPAKLAETVRRRLAQGDSKAAVNLARDGSRSMNSVVSWNHVMKHHIDQGAVKRALLTFNKMKKLGIKPDSYTFTILLNGISNYAHFGQSLLRALRIYNSLSSPKSPVPANVIHTNAVLKVCARANDLDSMWGIVGRLPMKGPNAPNTLTYTTLLNGIYWDRSKGEKLSDVEDGRRVWAGVLSRWTKGQLWIDEELACAMGRVLLRGEREEDWKEVFTVVEQVFGIKSLVAQPPPKLATEDSIYVENTNNLIQQPNLENAIIPTRDPVQVSDVEELFTPAIVSRHPSRDPSSSTRPLPGNSTLSLILQACAELKDYTTASRYWTTITNPPYSVVPDLENYHDLLRIIRRSRSGPEALNVVESMRVRPSAKTIYIALSACKRSGRSQNFHSAENLLSIMMADHGLLPVDVKIWNMFLQCAIKSDDPAHVKQALRRIDEQFNMKSELIQRRATPYYLDRALELLRAMIGAVDVLLHDGMKTSARWGHGERADFEDRRKALQTLLTVSRGWGMNRSYKADMANDEEPR